MNWKGENFYTGNRVPVFVAARQQGDHRVDRQAPRARVRTSCSSTRACANFKRMMGKRKVEELSTVRENNKFILVRADI